MIRWDFTINPSVVVGFITLVVMFVRMHAANVERITRFETKIDLMWQTWLKSNRMSNDT